MPRVPEMFPLLTFRSLEMLAVFLINEKREIWGKVVRCERRLASAHMIIWVKKTLKLVLRIHLARVSVVLKPGRTQRTPCATPFARNVGNAQPIDDSCCLQPQVLT